MAIEIRTLRDIPTMPEPTHYDVGAYTDLAQRTRETVRVLLFPIGAINAVWEWADRDGNPRYG